MDEETQKNLNLNILTRRGAANKAYNDRYFYKGLRNGIRTLAEKKYYCDKTEGETEDRYDKRLNRTEHYDVTGRAVDIYSSIPFEKRPVLKTKDEYIKSLYKSFDVRGQSVGDFGQEVLTNGLWDGMTNVFTDLPVSNGNGKAQTPYCFIINNDDIYNVVFDFKGELISFHFMTSQITQDPENHFSYVNLRTSRIYNKMINGKVYYDEYRENFKGDFIKQETQEFFLDYIPLKTFYPKVQSINTLQNPRSPVEALAHKNIEHLRSNTDQRNILHVVRVPILFGKGFRNEGNTITISASGVWVVEGEEGVDVDLKYVEPGSGKAIEGGRQDIVDILQQMEVLGLSVLNKKSNITATATNADERQNTSIMTSYAQRLQDFLNELIELMVDIKQKANGENRSKKPEFKLEIDSIYSDVHDQARIQYMQFLVSSSIVSGEVAVEYGKEIGVIEHDVEYEDEQEKILATGLTGIETSFNEE